MKEHKNLCQKPMSKMTLHFVWGHLPKKQTVVEYHDQFRPLKDDIYNENVAEM